MEEPTESPLEPGHIRDANRSMLMAAIKRDLPACVTVDMGIARDTEKELQEKITEALKKCDVLVTSGGVSMGELDLMHPILERLGKDW